MPTVESLTYKVMYHVGDTIDIRTKAATGRLSLDNGRLTITGGTAIDILLSDLKSVELFRLYGTGRMLKITHARGTLFVSVIRFCLFGYFAIVNFFSTGRLRDQLRATIQAPHEPA